MKTSILLVLLTVLLSSACQPTNTTSDAKPSLTEWNDTEVKKAIIDFVTQVSDKNSANFVPISERIAVFDNDGTLWNEKPLYIPVEIELDYIKDNYANKPEWQDDKLYTAIANDDLSVLGEYSTVELIQKLFGAHDGQREEAYKKDVYESLSTVMHRKFERPLKEMTYAPMVQLVHYLQAHDFDVYIVTGGEITSVRAISEEIYNIPKENVIGSSVAYKYIVDESGKYLIRTSKINSANDKQVKPTNIELHIGRQPIFAAGNSDGDYEMMQYTLANTLTSMAILVHHDDEEREYSYMHGTEKAVADAEKEGWYVVSMRTDFKSIWGFVE